MFLTQKKYALNLLMYFQSKNAKHVDTPVVQNTKFELDNGFPKINGSIYRSLIGSLLYFYASSPNIMFATSMLSRFMSSSSQNHYRMARLKKMSKG